ncbi:MAG: spore coat protein [Nitrospirales bacterium]|nr:MAG: spore coat protein [Nitrospirales bacterium]
MTPFLPFHLPSIGEDEIQSVVETLRSGWLTTGLKTKQFEQEFAEWIGVPHALAVNSCTAALHLALEAVGVTDGDEVIVPTMTFAATAEVVSYCRAVPILVDCQPDTLNINVDAMEQAITQKTKAIIPVHFAGHPCEMNRILAIARARNIKVIEDAAHALPSRYQGRMVGTLGDITCFSFYATKTMTTGEGGMVTTENPEWEERMRILSLHGITRNAVNRYTPEGSWYYEVRYPGYKYNLTDMASALGIVQLRKCHELRNVRYRYAALYNEGFKDIPEVSVPCVQTNIEHAWHLYVIQLDLKHLRIGRDEMIRLLKQNGIGTSVHFIPLHLHPYYSSHSAYHRTRFPVANKVFQGIISLPLYPNMTESDVLRVIEVVTKIVQTYRC